VQLCGAERSLVALPASTGNRRASDEHHFHTPKYKVACPISLVHPCFPFVGLLKLSKFSLGILLISEVSHFAPAKVDSPHVRFIIRRLRSDISSSNKACDPYSYTGGHWLHQGEQRQRARRLEFNFDALLDVAVKHCEGACEVVACEKKEGGFNRVFIIELDNGAKVVAKVPMRYAGPTALMTMSEVATMRYGMWHLRYERVGHELTYYTLKSEVRQVYLSLRFSPGAQNPTAAQLALTTSSWNMFLVSH